MAADKTGNEKIQDVLCDDRTVFYTVLFIHGFACACSIGISFTDFNMLETPNFVGWRNYIKLLLDDDVFKKHSKHDHLCSDHQAR